MGFGKKIFKGKMTGHRIFGIGGSRRWNKNLRRKIGLTSKNKWVRSLKRSLKRTSSPVASITPTTASDNSYKYQGKTLSQLTGGV